MKFTLQPEDKVELEKLAKSGMTPVIISQRAKILLKKAENKSSTVVAGEIGVNRHTVELWCQKYRDRGKDHRRGKNVADKYCLYEAERSWICRRNMDNPFAHETYK